MVMDFFLILLVLCFIVLCLIVLPLIGEIIEGIKGVVEIKIETNENGIKISSTSKNDSAETINDSESQEKEIVLVPTLSSQKREEANIPIMQIQDDRGFASTNQMVKFLFHHKQLKHFFLVMERR